jgi:DNA invertase Pin-like site-specific DNA recombinase
MRCTGTAGTELDSLMRDARLRRFDAVLMWKLDHWGPSLANCVRSIQELAALGARFVAITQNIDTDESNPAARLLLHIFAAFAEFERELIRSGCTRRAAQGRGKRLGRPRRVFRRDQALSLRAEGKSWREIAATLGVPFSTVIDACRAE